MRWYSSAIGSLTLRVLLPAPHVIRRRQDLRAGRDEVLVRNGRPVPSPGLDEHLVAAADEFVHAGRGDSHPVLVVLDFPGNSNLHGGPSRLWSLIALPGHQRGGAAHTPLPAQHTPPIWPGPRPRYAAHRRRPCAPARPAAGRPAPAGAPRPPAPRP